MAFTGDLELLNIVDIIQLLNTTRKSGTLAVKGSRGESRIIFSNGYIVGASHLNNRIRIGTVLVKMKAITPEALEQALKVQKSAGKARKPLIATLIELGKLGRDDAIRGLKKLIEITFVELIGWTKGTFTVDTEAISVSPDCTYPISRMEQEVSLEAQVILMDALRIFDERERDRLSGKTAPSDEELFSEVILPEASEAPGEKSLVVTAEDLGLGDLDHLERRIPESFPVDEIFDPAKIHRQKIKETLADFSADAQEAFVSFLEKSAVSRDARDGTQRRGGRTNGLILFSEDELVKHSVMTICKAEDALVFATEGEEELGRIMDQCLKIKVLPMVVFDTPETPEGMLSREKIVSLRQQVRKRYQQVSIIQIASLPDYSFVLQSFHDGVRAVFPKPSKHARKATFIEDMMQFLGTFKSYVKNFFHEQRDREGDYQLSRLKGLLSGLRNLNDPSAVSLALLQYVAEICERAITFIVRPAELTGERAIGVFAEKNEGPTSVTRLRVPLSEPSVFREVVERGKFFFGESNDKALKRHLYDGIGEPLSPTILLLPMKSRGRTVTLTYGDFGGKEASPVQSDLWEILADEAGLVIENALYRKQLNRASKK